MQWSPDRVRRDDGANRAEAGHAVLQASVVSPRRVAAPVVEREEDDRRARVG